MRRMFADEHDTLGPPPRCWTFGLEEFSPESLWRGLFLIPMARGTVGDTLRIGGNDGIGARPMSKGAVLMYTLNETELWRQRRDELMKEAGEERLARRLRAERQKGTSRGKTPLLGRLWAAFRTVPEKEMGVADCKE